jgi:hypothetical protein
MQGDVVGLALVRVLYLLLVIWTLHREGTEPQLRAAAYARLSETYDAAEWGPPSSPRPTGGRNGAAGVAACQHKRGQSAWLAWFRRFRSACQRFRGQPRERRSRRGPMGMRLARQEHGFPSHRRRAEARPAPDARGPEACEPHQACQMIVPGPQLDYCLRKVGYSGCPWLTAVFRPFWHGRSTDAGIRDRCQLTAPETVGHQDAYSRAVPAALAIVCLQRPRSLHVLIWVSRS